MRPTCPTRLRASGSQVAVVRADHLRVQALGDGGQVLNLGAPGARFLAVGEENKGLPTDGNPLVPGGLAEWMRSFIRISLSTGQNTSKMGIKPLCSKRWQLSKQEFMQRNANTYPPALRHIPGMERQAAPTTAMTTP